MKKLLLPLLFLLFTVLSFSQTYLTADFTGTYPPAGWTVDANTANWSAVNSSNAGCTLPELRFNYAPSFIGQSHFISPVVNTTGVTNLKVMFNHMLDYYTASQVTIGVATRANATAPWNIVWSKVNPPADIPATQEIVTINNTDVGSATFQFCFFFDGNSYNLDYWYIDNIKLFTPFAHDVMVKDITLDKQYLPGATVSPKVLVSNFGLNQETFTVTGVVKINGTAVYTQTSTNITLAAGADNLYTFPNYTATAANELFEFTATANLATDLDLTNNVKVKTFNTYTTPRNQVILEIGTGTWCQYCPGAQMGAHELQSNNKTVGVIENHNGDTFTNNASNARNTYYGISGYPTAVFDGLTKYIGGSNTVSMYTEYLPIYDAKKLVNSAYTIGIYGTWVGANYTLTLVLNKLATTPVYNDLRLQVALTESDIPFAWQGQTMVHSAQRLMVPDENGTALTFGSGSLLKTLTFTLPGTSVLANCELVAFIQDHTSKEIFQGAKVKLSNLMPTPVELTSFTAFSSSKGITLNWVTATELNNRGFEIQKSNDGVTYYTIGFIKGAGSTTEQRNYSYNDLFENKGKQLFYYRLKQLDLDGRISYSNVVTVDFNCPLSFTLDQNYPNPFNPSTKISFSIPQKEYVTLKVYDILGNEAAVLVNEVKEQGVYSLNFNALNLSSGTYIYKLTAGSFTSVKKMLLIK